MRGGRLVTSRNDNSCWETLNEGCVSGVLATDFENALQQIDDGIPTIYVVEFTTPQDNAVLVASVGLICHRGGQASHSAIVARQYGLPALSGVDTHTLVGGSRVELDATRRTITHDAVDEVAVGNSARDSAAILKTGPTTNTGSRDTNSAASNKQVPEMTAATDPNATQASTLCEVAVNVDSAALAHNVAAVGAKRIGLCRAEFLVAGSRMNPDRLEQPTQTDVNEFEQVFAEQLTNMFNAVGTSTQSISLRLLDCVPPNDADHQSVHGARHLLAHPLLIGAHATALAHATRASKYSGTVTLVTPNVATVHELDAITAYLDRAFETHPCWDDATVTYGAMVETPRACLVAGELASRCDQLCFGTNDLTALTYGWPRTPPTGYELGSYLRAGVIEGDPFVELDQVGVVRLLALATDLARSVHPEIELGLCGAQAAQTSTLGIAEALRISWISVPLQQYDSVVARQHSAQVTTRSSDESSTT